MRQLNGRRVCGDIQESQCFKPQYPKFEFSAALDDVLDSGLVDAVRWSQYTPYFNDGEPCVFGANDPDFRLTEAGRLAARLTSSHRSDDDGFYDSYILKELPIKKALDAFSACVTHGNHDALLSETFGDHAVVTATKEKFVVDNYEHE